MTAAEIRQRFLDYFAARGHQPLPSGSLVPADDPTLLFTNAGMVPFKRVFLGLEQRDFKRAVTSQKCVRAGGKHNDLEEVGKTTRHHTFFEMLGNFSFGDYFKAKAVAYAWEFLVDELGLEPDRLVVTVHDSDDEAERLWIEEVGVPADRVFRLGDEDNFWQMADTGPCGPCSELHYDLRSDKERTGALDRATFVELSDEGGFVELWNLVFMQYDRGADGVMTPLPAPSIDTGAGLERLAGVLQGADSNFHTDLFRPLLTRVAEVVGRAYAPESPEGVSYRVLADHARAVAFLLADGVFPSNEGRGYVLRRILRRAVRHAWLLGRREPTLVQVVEAVIETMGDVYPELDLRRQHLLTTTRAEEERFLATIEGGLTRFEELAPKGVGGTIPGEEAFRLYDTYGFPFDLTQDIARERNLDVDQVGFERAMERQRETARAAGRFGGALTLPAELVAKLQPTRFQGYEEIRVDGLEIVALLRDGRPVDAIQAGEEAVVLLDRTPFYAESGGQVGDAGTLVGAESRFQVDDTRKLAGQFHGHLGRLAAGSLRVGDRVLGAVGDVRRGNIVLNHSATHLLHGALRELLGTHVQQKGSLVAPDRLRFDFSHFEPVAREELAEIERRVNREVRANHPVLIREMGMQEAMDAGAIALFGEKYGDRVRVVQMGASVELCGGTHVGRTGEIGLFKLVSEGGVSAGVRRVEALTGEAALDHVATGEGELHQAAGLLGGTSTEVPAKLRTLLERQKKLERELESLKASAASGATADLAAQAVDVGGVKVLTARLEGFDAKALREAVDQLKQRLKDTVVVLAGTSDGKASLVAGVGGGAGGRIRAGDLLGHVAGQIGGKGGGRPDLAQGGGPDGPELVAALKGVNQWVADRLQ